MLKLPGRGKKGVSKSSFFSPYKHIFRKEIRKVETVDSGEFKKTIIPKKIVERDASKKVLGNLRLRGVEKSFAKNQVLNGINLDIKKGEIMGIVGVSGSGKTTMLRLIISFYRPDKGVISFNTSLVSSFKILKTSFTLPPSFLMLENKIVT